jgi:hypothetical protein
MAHAELRTRWLDAGRPWRPALGELVIGIAVVPVVVIALLAVTEPWRALALGLGLGVATAVVVWPRLGIYVMAAFLIGQWPFNLTRYLGLVVVAGAALWVIRRRRALIPRDALLTLSALYVGVVLVSTISPSTRINIASGVITAVNCATLVWLCLTLIDSRKAVRTVTGVMVGAAVVTALVGFVQAYTHFTWPASTLAEARAHAFNRGKSLLELHGWQGEFRIDSITGTPDFLGVTMMIVMPFVLCWLLRQRRPEPIVLGSVVLLVLGVAGTLSFTRGAFVITPIVLFLAVWLTDRKRVMPLVVALMGVFLGMLTWGPLRERLIAVLSFTRSTATGELDAAAWRLHVVPTALEMIWQRPFLGVGIDQQVHNWPDSAGDLVPLIVPGLSPPLHNMYLLAGVELGVLGLAVVLALVLVTAARLRALVQRFERRGEVELASYAKAALASFVGLVLAGLLYPMLGHIRYFWLVIGLAAALDRIERTLPDPSSAGADLADGR